MSHPDPTDPTDPTEPTDQMNQGDQGDQPAQTDRTDPALVAVVREIEQHAAGQGWDQPARLYALVPTADLLSREPGLASALGVEGEPEEGSLTPVEQEPLAPDADLEELLGAIMWPAEVAGCAVVVERLVLPPSADDELPEDPAAAQEFARAHPERQEVRMVAAARRGGDRFCALRLRAHDDDFSVLEGPELVPALLELLAATLEQ